MVGGAFLLSPCGESELFFPERMDAERRSLAESAARFFCERVLPLSDRIEGGEEGLVRRLMNEAGKLGLFMAEAPEPFGLGLSAVDGTIIAENAARQGSFVVSFLCHAGIGIFPLILFGNEEQKGRFLPGMVSGERIGAFALTEAEAGSDAAAIRTRAVRAQGRDGYLLTGEKIYCTNAGIADLFTVFAKTDDDRITAFAVERATPGISAGKEEEKMGIHGSSTASLSMEGAFVPSKNVIGEAGGGLKVAYTVLDAGRMKLAAACVGSGKRLVEAMAIQAKTRKQFGREIASFELIRQKIARSAARVWLAESLVYRLAGGMGAGPAAVGELSIEAAIAKVFCSETVAFAADEAVALFGGAGFIRGYPPESAYRDCRVDRIFEGTNEICRLYVASALIKRALSGKLPLMQRLGEILAGLKGGFAKEDPASPLAEEASQVESLKRLCVYLAGVALKKFGEKISSRQAILETVADLAIEACAFDSGVARARALIGSADAGKARALSDACGASLAERVPLLVARARQALINTAGGDEAECVSYLKALSRLVEERKFDTDAAWNRVAERVLEDEGLDV